MMPYDSILKELVHYVCEPKTSGAIMCSSQEVLTGDAMTDGDQFRVAADEDNTKLSLGYEDLDEFPASLLSLSGSLTYLDISHNKLKNFDFVCRFDFLTTLIADHNGIKSDVRFPRMQNLQILWLNNNHLTALCPWLQWLKDSCPKLKHLSLMENPVTENCLDQLSPYHHQYKLMVLFWFPELVYLDHSKITNENRKDAKANRLSDRLSSGEIWQNWFRMPNMNSTQQTHFEKIKKNKSYNCIV